MFKAILVVSLALIACVVAVPKAKPGVIAAAPLAVAPSVVTATSYQSFVRGYSAPLVAASYVASPYVAAPYAASPYVAAAPLIL